MKSDSTVLRDLSHVKFNVVESYFYHLAKTPERIDGLLMWTVCTLFIWFWMVRFKERAIKGMEGSNAYWEGSEQVVYWSIFAMWPIIFYAAFIKDIPIAVWYFLAFLIGFALLGRSVLDYGLAFLGRAPIAKETVKEPGPVVNVNVDQSPKP